MTKNNKNKKLEALEDSMIAEAVGGSLNEVGENGKAIGVDKTGKAGSRGSDNSMYINGDVDGTEVGNDPFPE